MGLVALAALLAAGCGLSDKDVARRPGDPRFPVNPPRNTDSGSGSDPAGSSGSDSTAGSSGDTSVGGNASGGVDPAGMGGGPSAPPFDAGSDPNRNDVGAGQLCERFATIQCAGERTCCANPGRDFEACKSALKGSCTTDLLFDQIAAQPAAGFEQARVKPVLDELERLASMCDPGTVAYGESQEGLRSMFRGTIGPGQSCRPANLLNKTQAGAALAACTMSESQACLPSATTWTCVPRAGAGGACFTDINCQPGLFCDNPNLDLIGSNCMPRKADGASCRNANECTSLFCSGGKCVPPGQQVAYCPE